MEFLDRFLVQIILHKKKKFIRTDKISEILNDSESDGGSFSELSDRDTCEVNSPFSSSSNSEEVYQPEPDTDRKRRRRAIPKRANTDFELGWKEQIRKIQKPAFPGVPEINKNFHISQDSSPFDIFEIFFSSELFKRIQNETTRYATHYLDVKNLLVYSIILDHHNWNHLRKEDQRDRTNGIITALDKIISLSVTLG